MIVYTPDLAYNTSQYRAIWADGTTPALHLLPCQGEQEDYILFDSPESAVKAFDAVINGISRGCRTLLVRETTTPDGKTVLHTEYDSEYSTMTQEGGGCIIRDPRHWDEKTSVFMLQPSATIKS